MKHLTIALASLLLFAPNADAKTKIVPKHKCYTRVSLANHFSKLGIRVTQRFLTSDGHLMELWKAPDGSWALLVVNGPIACPVVTGYASEVVPNV